MQMDMKNNINRLSEKIALAPTYLQPVDIVDRPDKRTRQYTCICIRSEIVK